MKSRPPDRTLAARTWSRLAVWFGAADRATPRQFAPEPARTTLPSNPPGPLRRRGDNDPAASPDSAPPGSTVPGDAADDAFDAQTGLATRARFEALEAQLTQELAGGTVAFSVLRLTVGGLQPVVDRYGAGAGDHVLVQIGKRLRNAARSTDRVFRLEGDEFVVLLRCPAKQAAALSRTLATRLVGDLQRPFSYRTLSNLRVQCWAGTAVWPTDAQTLGEVVALAEQALQAASIAGVGQVRQHANVAA